MISVAIITFNEEKNTEACLKSITEGSSHWKSLISEIVIVDSGSTDMTESISRQFQKVRFISKVPFLGHIQQKQFAVDQCNQSWILSLDADERLTPELQHSISNAVLEKGTAFQWNRLNHFGGIPVRHGRWYPDRKVRLWHREDGHWGGMNPHDCVVTNLHVAIELLRGSMLHYTCTGEDHFKATMNRYAELGRKARLEQGKKGNWAKRNIGSVFHFIADYIFRGGFLDGEIGWIIAREQFVYTRKKYRSL